MTKTWGTPVHGLIATKTSGDYLPKTGEKIRIDFKRQNFMMPPPEHDPEAYIIEELRAKFGETEHWELLYVKVMVKQRIAFLNFWDAWGEVHLKTTQALTIATALAIILIIVALVAVGTWIYSLYKFEKAIDAIGEALGLGDGDGIGGLVGGLVILVMVFLVFIFIGGYLQTDKFKVGKG